MPYTAKVNGSLVNVIAGTLNVENQIGQRAQGSMGVWTNPGTFWQYGTQVQVYDDTSALAYSGFVTKDKLSRDPGARQGVGYLLHELSLMDNAYKADKRRVFSSYLNVSAGYIVRDLLGKYLAAEGVTKTASSIANGPTIAEVIWNGNKSVADALTWLAERAGYWWQIDVNNVLWFQPYGSIPAPLTLDGTNVDSMQSLTVEFGNEQYVTKQFAKGSYAETGILTETLKGDGSKRSFTLSYPVSRIYSIALDGLDVTAVSLAKGSSGGMFYWARGDAVVAQDTGYAVLTTSDSIVVTYRGRFPVLASAQNATHIASQKTREGGGTGLVEAIYSDTKVRTLGAAFQIASTQLAHFGADIANLTFSTRQKGLAAGQLMNVSLPDFGITNTSMLITSMTITDQNDGINIWYNIAATGTVSSGVYAPLENAQYQTFWKNLMAQSSDPSDYTDAEDTTLALLSSSTMTATHSVSTHFTKTTCPIFSNATLFSNTTIFC